jgi:preprotein translocase subunit Sec61beta
MVKKVYVASLMVVIGLLGGCVLLIGLCSRRSAGGGGGSIGSASINTGSAGMFRMWYNEDSPGLKVGPTIVLIASLAFIVLVLIMHFWSRFRG